MATYPHDYNSGSSSLVFCFYFTFSDEKITTNRLPISTVVLRHYTHAIIMVVHPALFLFHIFRREDHHVQMPGGGGDPGRRVRVAHREREAAQQPAQN